MGLADNLVTVQKEIEPAWLPGLREAAAGAAISTAEEVRKEFGTDRWHAAAMPEVVVEATTATRSPRPCVLRTSTAFP